MPHSTQSSSGSAPISNVAEIEARPTARPAAAADEPARHPQLPRERGGRDGPDPTRFGDWEKGGRCIDF